MLLASLDAKFRRDAQLAGPQICSVALDDASADVARDHGIQPLEVRPFPRRLIGRLLDLHGVWELHMTLARERHFIPGSTTLPHRPARRMQSNGISVCISSCEM